MKIQNFVFKTKNYLAHKSFENIDTSQSKFKSVIFELLNCVYLLRIIGPL